MFIIIVIFPLTPSNFSFPVVSGNRPYSHNSRHINDTSFCIRIKKCSKKSAISIFTVCIFCISLASINCLSVPTYLRYFYSQMIFLFYSRHASASFRFSCASLKDAFTVSDSAINLFCLVVRCNQSNLLCYVLMCQH